MAPGAFGKNPPTHASYMEHSTHHAVVHVPHGQRHVGNHPPTPTVVQLALPHLRNSSPIHLDRPLQRLTPPDGASQKVARRACNLTYHGTDPCRGSRPSKYRVPSVQVRCQAVATALSKIQNPALFASPARTTNSLVFFSAVRSPGPLRLPSTTTQPTTLALLTVSPPCPDPTPPSGPCAVCSRARALDRPTDRPYDPERTKTIDTSRYHT